MVSVNRRDVAALGLCAALALVAAACGGDAAPIIECGPGTVLENNTCQPDGSLIEDPDPEVTCGEGTVLQDGACVPEVASPTCAEGTELQNGLCLPVREEPNCGPGTALVGENCEVLNELCEEGQAWRDGACVTLSELCGPGTLWAEGTCVTVDPLATIPNREAQEPNDPAQGGEAGNIPRLDQNVPWRTAGVLEGDGVQPDVDVFRFVGNPGERFRVEATAVGAPSVAFLVRYLPDPGQPDPGFVRAAVPFADRNSHRELVLPFAGRYELRLGHASDILEELGLEARVGDPVSGAGLTWGMTVERLRNRAPQPVDGASFETFGTFAELLQAQVQAPEGSLIRVALTPESDAAQPILWGSDTNYGGFSQGQTLYQVGAQGLLLTVDNLYEASQRGGFRLQGREATVADAGALAPGRSAAVELTLPGGEEGFARVTTQEPLVLAVRAEAITQGADPSLTWLDQGLVPVARSQGEGEESMRVFLAQPGTHHFAVRGQGEGEERFQVTLRAAPVQGFGELVLNSPAQTLVNEDIGQVGQVGWFSLDSERLGSLVLNAEPASGANVALHLLRSPLLSLRGQWVDPQTRDQAPAGEAEALDWPVDPTTWVVGVEVTGLLQPPARVELAATLLNSQPLGLDEEPNDVFADAEDVGTLTERPLFLRGSLAASEAGETVDLYQVTLTGTAEIHVRAWPYGEAPEAATGAWISVWEAREGGRELASATPSSGFGELEVALSPGAYLIAVQAPGDAPTGDYFVTAQIGRRLSCVPGQTACSGANLQVCGSQGDGFLGLACNSGDCRALSLGDDCGARPEAAEPNESAFEAIALGDVARGRLAILGELSTVGDEDWYSFTLEQGSIVTVGTMPNPARPGRLADTRVTVFSAAGAQVASDEDSGQGRYGLLRDLSLPAGTWRVRVDAGATGQTGAYRFFVDRFDYFCDLGAGRCAGQTLEVCTQGLRFEPQEVCAESCRAEGDQARCVSLGEPNDGPEESSPVDLPLRFEASLDIPNDEDWYEITLPEALELSASTSLTQGGRAVDTRIRLCAQATAPGCTWESGYVARNDDATGIPGSYSALRAFVEEPGTYYVVVDSGGGVGDYTMDLREAGEPNEQAAQARPAALMDRFQARIRPASDVDWYRFEVAAPGRWVFTTSPLEPLDQVDTRVWLCDDSAPQLCAYNQSDLARDDNSGVGLYARLSYNFTQAGTYYLGVQGFGNRGGGYTLRLELDVEPNDDANQATDIGVPWLDSGDLESAQDQDWLRFYAVAGENLSFETRPVEGGTPVNTRVFLCDDSDPDSCAYGAGALTQADDGIFPQYSRMSFTVQQAGNHYYVIEGVNGGTGDYLAFVDSASEPDDTAADAQPISLPGLATGRLMPEGDVDWYRLQLNAPAFLQLATEAPAGAQAVQTRLALCDTMEEGACAYNQGDLARAQGDQSQGYARLFYDFPSAGTWYIAVSAAQPGGVGHYSLRLSGAGEPNNMPGQATRVTAPGVAFGRVQPGDLDWFTWTTQEPLALTVRTSALGENEPADTRLWICDNLAPQSCTLMAGNLGSDGGEGFSQVDVELAQPGTYYAVVDTAAGEGAYQLEILEQTEPNNIPALATEVALAAPLSTRLAPEGDVDWYALELGGPVALELVTSARPGAPLVDTRLFLCAPGAQGCTYAEGYLARGEEGPQGYASLRYNIPAAGRYLFAVESAAIPGEGQGHYTVEARELGEPNDSPAQAVQLNVPQDVFGRVAQEDDVDWYSFEVPGPVTLTFETRDVDGGVAMNPRIFLCLEAGVETCSYQTSTLPRDDNGGRGAHARLDVGLAVAGRYYVAVESADGSVGNYRLLAQVSPEPNDSAPQATEVTLPLTLETTLSRASDKDWYRFEVEQGDLLVFETNLVPGAESESVDTVMFLCDDTDPANCSSQSGHLVMDDNSNGNFYSRFEWAFDDQGGVFYVVVESFGFRGGEYKLDIYRPGEPNDVAAEATPLSPPAMVEGRLTGAQDQDWYLFAVASNTTLFFETLQPSGGLAVDTRIWLCDTTQPEVCAYDFANLLNDDNGGQGGYSRLQYTFPQGGDYFVVIESADGGFGDYTLRVTR